jgi:hypothetical protein
MRAIRRRRFMSPSPRRASISADEIRRTSGGRPRLIKVGCSPFWSLDQAERACEIMLEQITRQR